jgi:hypothetical protein
MEIYKFAITWAITVSVGFSTLLIAAPTEEAAKANKEAVEQQLQFIEKQLEQFDQHLSVLRQQHAELLPKATEALIPKGKTWPAIPLDAVSLSQLPVPDQDKLKVDRRAMLRFIVADKKDLPGVVVDDTEAELVGTWQHSVHTPAFVGKSYIHDQNKDKGKKSVTYRPKLTQAGMYQVRMSHNANATRSNRVMVTISHADGQTVVYVNEHEQPPLGLLFRSLGQYRFEVGTKGFVRISNTPTDTGHIIADAMWFVPVALIGKTVAPMPKFVKKRRLNGSQLRKMDAFWKQWHHVLDQINLSKQKKLNLEQQLRSLEKDAKGITP